MLVDALSLNVKASKPPLPSSIFSVSLLTAAPLSESVTLPLVWLWVLTSASPIVPEEITLPMDNPSFNPPVSVVMLADCVDAPLEVRDAV